MTLTELIESERSDLAKLRKLRLLHPNHAETLLLVAEMSDEKAARVISLTELLHYKGEESGTNGHAISGAGVSAAGAPSAARNGGG